MKNTSESVQTTNLAIDSDENEIVWFNQFNKHT